MCIVYVPSPRTRTYNMVGDTVQPSSTLNNLFDFVSLYHPFL